MRLIFTLTVLIAIDIYAFQAFRVIAQNWSPTAKAILYTLYWGLTAYTLFFFLASASDYTEDWSKNTITFSRALVFIIAISKLLIIPFLLIDDLRRLGVWAYSQYNSHSSFDHSRMRFFSQLAVTLSSVPFFSLLYGIIRNPYRYRVFETKVSFAHLPASLDGLKIVQISDIHSGSFTFKEPIRNAIDLINAQKPDLVFFTGDLVNNKADEMDNYMDVFDKIRAKYGVYSVFGNHDYGEYVRWNSQEEKEANLSKLENVHKKLGWQLLRNQNQLLDINGEEVAIIGVENYSAHPRFPKYGDLPKSYAGTENAQLRLLLSHDPSHWKDQVTKDFQDVHLTFSGHTHGMQFGVEIPGWIKWSPIKFVYKEWAGLYKNPEVDQYLYVNRGLGFLGYPGRVGILPEITVLEVKKA
ncbi:MAG: metallophosphoesterase [Saprospiraceae bacterium]|nr:metallophosphoesterase [Saprospiraceae bacterium]